jgi:integrase
LPKKRVKITKEFVAKARPHGGKLTFFWDSELIGFGLQVTTNEAKSYVIKYRIGAESRRMVIGRVGPELPPEAARRKATAELGKVRVQGRDVVKERWALRAEATLGETLDKWMREFIEPKRKSRTAEEYARLIKNHIKPALSSRQLSAVTRADVNRMHAAIGANTKRTANHVVDVLRSFYNWVERNMRVVLPNGNPATKIEKFSETARTSFFSADQFVRLAEAFELADQGKLGISLYAIACFRLLLFTGARREEIRTATWEMVDFDRKLLILRDHKGNRAGRTQSAKAIPLSAAAMDVLNRIPRVNGNSYIIVGEVPGQPYVGLKKAWKRLCEVAEIPNGLEAGDASLRIHDLRHSFGTIALDENLPLSAVQKLMGHSDIAMTMRYSHLSGGAGRAATEQISAAIMKKLGAGAANGTKSTDHPEAGRGSAQPQDADSGPVAG